MKNYSQSVCILILILFATVSSAQAEGLKTEKSDIAVDFKLQDLSQNMLSLSSYRGKQPVLLIFWTTLCPFCLQAVKRLNQIYPKLVKAGYELLAINVEEPVSKVNNFVKKYALVFKVLLDKDAAVAQTYGVVGVPTYILVDRSGSINYKGNNFPEELLNGSPSE